MRKEAMTCLALASNLAMGLICCHGQQIGCSQTVAGAIESAGQTNTYTYNAGGERVTILVLGQATNIAADIFGPGGMRIASWTNNFSGPLSLGIQGIYAIKVRGDGSATGAYGLSLTDLTGQCGTPLVWGRPAAANLASLAEVDSYTFSGNAGETVVLAASSTNFVAAAFLADPSGTIVANWVNGSTTVGLAASGKYTVGLYPFFTGGTGSYAVSLTFTQLTPASFRLALQLTNHAAGLMIWGQLGRMTSLQYATDLGLQNWTPLTNFSLPWSPYYFVDSGSVNSPRRLYRTVQ